MQVDKRALKDFYEDLGHMCYREEVRGQGAFGTVYECEHEDSKTLHKNRNYRRKTIDSKKPASSLYTLHSSGDIDFKILQR